MKSKTMTVKKLRNLVQDCLTEGFTLAFFLPDALDGDTEGLAYSRSKEGRLAIKEEDWPRYKELILKGSEENP